MEEIKGCIARIEKTEKDGTCLFYLDTPSIHAIRQKNGLVLCKGFTSRITINMPITLSGEWENGIFSAKEYKLTWIGNQATINFLTKNCKGIGKKTAGVICSLYGKDLFRREKADLKESLHANLPKLSPELIDRVLQVLFQEKQGLFELEKIFSQLSVDYSSLLEMYETYGDDAVKKLNQDPYQMGIRFDLPFTAVDNIAYLNGMSAIDMKRVTGIIQYKLKYAASSGHTYVKAKNLAQSVSYTSEDSRYTEPIPALYVSTAIAISKNITNDNGKVALNKFIYAEKEIAKRLSVLNATHSNITVTEEKIDKVEKEIGCTFGRDQRKAFTLLGTSGIIILTGGPGTGKTTTVKGLVRYFRNECPDKKIVSFCAPTGRAAKRLSESVGEYASTVHKLLEFKPFDKENTSCLNQNNPIQADLIVVDEVSMVGVELMCLLLDAVKNGTIVLLVGDENQLPSVDAGNVLHDLIASKKFPVCRLNENFRQASGGHIVENSKRILKGRLPIQTNDFRIYQAADEEEAFQKLQEIADRFYDTEHPFRLQFIAPSTKGTAGTIRMNQYVHTNIVQKDKKNITPQPTIDDKIIFNKTNYDDGYINGDIGVIESLTADTLTVWNDAEKLVLPANAIHALSLAYSYTVHKSQGSENDLVVIYLPKSMAHMMTRSLFYTAVTRAKLGVYVIYTEDALQMCIRNTKDIRRNTRLQEFLGEC